MKITDSCHRSHAQIGAELHWINYLSDHGVPVCRALPSVNGKLVETVSLRDIGDSSDLSFSLIAVDKAKGKLATFDDRDNALIEQWGVITGLIHFLTRQYQPPAGSERRFSWFDDGFMAWATCSAESHSQPLVVEKCQDIIRKLQSLPTDDDSFGLIHADLHHWNFFAAEGAMSIFDTDDCRYDWFAHDLAIPLFYSLFDPKRPGDRESFAREFFGYFIRGYRQENTIDDFWIERVPLFMKLRELDLYLLLLQEDKSSYDGWCRNFMKDRRDCIENDIPVITHSLTGL